MRSSCSSMESLPLPGAAEVALHTRDALLVATVERPLLDPLGDEQAGVDEHPQVLAGGGLPHSQLASDENAADAVLDQIAVHLRRKVGDRVAQPVEDLQP